MLGAGILAAVSLWQLGADLPDAGVANALPQGVVLALVAPASNRPDWVIACPSFA